MALRPQITVRLPVELRERLVKRAAKEDRSEGWVIRKALEVFLGEDSRTDRPARGSGATVAGRPPPVVPTAEGTPPPPPLTKAEKIAAAQRAMAESQRRR